MSSKTIILLYKEQESKIDINLSEINTYSLLLKHILSFYNESDIMYTFHLMAINSSTPYTLLDEENFNQIMNEEIQDDHLKLFLNKINPTDMNDDIKDADEKDDDFVIDEGDDDNNKINKEEVKQEEKKQEEKENDNKININNNDEIDKQLKINENYNIINDDDKNMNIEDIKINEQELFNESDEMMKKIDLIMGGGSLNLLDDSNSNMKNEIKLENKLDDKEEEEDINTNININKTEDEKKTTPQIPFSNKNQNLNIINIINEEEKDENEDEDNNNASIQKEGIFNTTSCTICKSKLDFIKYICCVCENCILCEGCEKTHYHPCFKLKTKFLANYDEIFKFISTNYSFKSTNKNFFTKLFAKENEVKLIPISDEKICLRPNKSFIFLVKIQNLTKNPINSSKFELISQNNKLIKILNQNIIFEVGPNSKYIYKFKCKSKKKLGKETVKFHLFTDSLIFKNKTGLDFDIDFEINEDLEEEKMNLEFENNEYAMLFNKEHKQTASEILNDVGIPLSKKEDVKKAFEILVNNNWDKTLSINKIKDLKK